MQCNQNCEPVSELDVSLVAEHCKGKRLQRLSTEKLGYLIIRVIFLAQCDLTTLTFF